MAPKVGRPAKRVATEEAAGAPSPKKIPKKTQKDETKAVVEALGEAKLSKQLVHLLKHSAPACLSTFADQRHPYQASVIGMIEEALASVEGGLKEKVKEAEAAAGALNRDAREKDVLASAKALADRKSAAAHKEADLVGATLQVKKAAEVVKVTTKAQTVGDIEFNRLEKAKAKLEACVGSVEKAKTEIRPEKELGALRKELLSYELDESLAISIVPILGKEAGTRSEFEVTTLATLDAALASKVGELTPKLEALRPEKDERAAAKEKAEAAQAAAKQAADTVKASFTEAQNASKEAEAALHKADEAFTDFVVDKKSADNTVGEAKEELVEFIEGPLAVFASLKSRTTPPPAPEVAASEPAAADAPAATLA